MHCAQCVSAASTEWKERRGQHTTTLIQSGKPAPGPIWVSRTVFLLCWRQVAGVQEEKRDGGSPPFEARSVARGRGRDMNPSSA